MIEHTPGPWTAKQGDGRYNYRWYIEARAYSTPTVISGRDQIAQLPAGDPHAAEYEANARLIAAAPDMLAALRDVLTAHGEQLHDAFAAAHAAIAKATGGVS